MMFGGGGGGENETLMGGRMKMKAISSSSSSSLLLPLQLNPATISVEAKKEAHPLPSPQWSAQETRDFISIRADLERDFTATKRNKTLWEVVASRMKERGYRRSPDQCKCKWKNLVNRYKGKETSDPENGRQCPFFEELHAVFTERARNMQRLLLESETGSMQVKKRKKLIGGEPERSLDEFSEYEDEDEDESEEDRLLRSSNPQKRKYARGKQVGTISLDKSSGQTHPQNITNTGSIQELLLEFFQHQHRMEMQWRESMERHARERELFEQEWRQSMEKLERERLMFEQAWRERVEQRRTREESRAEKRDALLTTLLNKLIHEEF
ncbi:Myb/SANT-like DNA-binding domain 4 [Dillenia turbinata]|uniref:Myb/SANT-like DNA-binding domain 4 n=1 Tax=Dillenia turbinata TaxID=194707 RepID=A0AAN8VN83_9MAGN